MDLLPPPAEQEALLAELKEVVREAGPAPLLAWPVVWAADRWFPDPFSADPRGLARLLLRLLRYAHLDDVPVGVELLDGQLVDEPDTLATFVEAEDDDAPVLAVTPAALFDPDALVALLALQVAGLWRAVRGLQVDDADEPRRTALTAVALGFGPLVANAAELHRTEGGVDGNLAWTQYRRSWLGALPWQSLSFLLAAQLVLRGDDAETKAVLAHLQHNQRTACEKAMRLLADLGPALEERLLLPPRGRRPAREDDAAFTGPLDEAQIDDMVGDLAAEDDEGEAEDDDDHPTRPTFRVWQSPWLGYAIGGALLGVAGGAVAAVKTGMDLLLPVLVGATTAGGFLFGRSRSGFVCTDPDCRSPLTPADARCPGCRRPVVGELKHADERLEAEEAWRRSRRLGS